MSNNKLKSLYQVPSADLENTPVRGGNAQIEGFKTPKNLTRLLKGVLILSIALPEIFRFLSKVFYYIISEQPDLVDMGWYAEGNDYLFFVASVTTILIFLRMILTLIWVYRANKNIWALGGKDLRFKPSSTIIWFLCL